jgi:hypothetical protein
MRYSPWIGDNVTLVESEDEDHCFHLSSPLRVTSKKLMEAMAQFINQCAPPTDVLSEHKRRPWIELEGNTKTYSALSVPTRPFMRIMVNELDMKVKSGPSFMASAASFKNSNGKTFKKNDGLSSGRVRIDKGSMKPLSATLLGSFGMKSIF